MTAPITAIRLARIASERRAAVVITAPRREKLVAVKLLTPVTFVRIRLVGAAFSGTLSQLS